MKKRILVIMTTAILTIGVVTVVYAKEKDYTMMNQNNINNTTYNKMIDLMKYNGFKDGAKAMENRDFNYMNNFMNNITDEQYNKMIDLMRNNGYEDMAKMMGSVNRQEMVNIHSRMMGR